jgi:hypothetical protein
MYQRMLPIVVPAAARVLPSLAERQRVVCLFARLRVIPGRQSVVMPAWILPPVQPTVVPVGRCVRAVVPVLQVDVHAFLRPVLKVRMLQR